MPGQLSVPSHTTFFDGYLDAVGRHYTDEVRLCAISATVLPAAFMEHREIVSATPVDNMVREFQRDIVTFLDADPRDRLVFHLIEYFDWFKQFSDNCICQRVRVRGQGFPNEHIAYRLLIDHTYEVLFLAYWKDKNDMPKTP